MRASEARLSPGQPDESYPTTYGPEHSHVSLEVRAFHLINALEAMSKRNQREGFVYASDVDPYAHDIWGQYRGATSQMQKGASVNEGKYHQEVKRQFWAATGFAALRGSSLVSRQSADKMAKKMYRDFEREYGFPQEIKQRRAYKNQLKKNYRSVIGVQLALDEGED